MPHSPVIPAGPFTPEALKYVHSVLRAAASPTVHSKPAITPAGQHAKARAPALLQRDTPSPPQHAKSFDASHFKIKPARSMLHTDNEGGTSGGASPRVKEAAGQGMSTSLAMSLNQRLQASVDIAASPAAKGAAGHTNKKEGRSITKQTKAEAAHSPRVDLDRPRWVNPTYNGEPFLT